MADKADPGLTNAANKMKGLLDDPLASPAPEPEQQAAPETEQQTEQAEPETQETLEAAETETEQETSEATETEEETPDATETGAEPGAETYELGADELAGLLGLDEDKIQVSDDGSLSFRVNEGGKESDVNLSDLINAHQGNANLTNRSKQIAELEKQRVSEIQQFQEVATKQAQQAAITLEAINNNYLAEYNSIDWNGLKTEDPAMYAAKSVEMSQKKQQLDELIQQTVAAVNEQQKVVDSENTKLTQQRLVTEQERTRDGFKALNVKVDDGLQKAVIGYLTEQFDTSEMQNLVDHRHMLMAYKAMQFDKGMKTAQSKKVKKIPKVLKSGKQPTKQTVKLNEAKKLKSNLKKSGSVDDAAALLKGRLSG